MGETGICGTMFTGQTCVLFEFRGGEKLRDYEELIEEMLGEGLDLETLKKFIEKE